jgi:hypothetical protein
MRLRPPEITVAADLPLAQDKLDRGPFVEATVELLSSIREPFVVALNAPWGSGKTTTLKLLEPALTKAGMTAISFNAWEVDCATDPLVPLVATMHDRLLLVKGYGKHVDASKVEQWKKAGGALVKHTAIATVKAATAGLLDISAIADSVSNAAVETTMDTSGALANDVIDLFKRERLAGQQFRELLDEITAYLRKTAPEGDQSRPVILIIDELDRCRPTFAVAMLERIKHFFGVPGLVFLLAVDLQQLEAGTRKVYGAELDAAEYLRRFVDLELALPKAKLKPMIEGMLSACGADAFFADRRGDRDWTVDAIETLANHFNLSLRLIEKIVTRVMLVVRQTPSNHYFDAVLVVFMIFLRIRKPDLFRGVVSGRTQAGEIIEALAGQQSTGVRFRDTRLSKLLEAYLLYAHQNETYAKEVVSIDRTGDAAARVSSRLLEVLELHGQVRREHFRRGRIDLAKIAQRIDLVAIDIATSEE